MILVYVPELTVRIQYIFFFIFEKILGISIQFTDSEAYFSEQKIPKFSYSHQPIENEIHFQSSHLLFESTCKKQNITDLLQDPFSLAFYLISRYEEYIYSERDSHQRFSYSASPTKNTMKITQPWIDQWAYNFFEELKTKFPTLEKKERSFQFINTIDLDHAWLYRNKSLFGNLKSLGKKIVTFQGKKIIDQIKIILNKYDDPYDIYPYLNSLQKPITYFIPFGNQSKWDTHHNPKNKEYRNLIQTLDRNPLYTLGFHPGYQSSSDFKILKKEKEDLDHLLHRNITYSRQHFIKLHLPDTYRNLIKLGITKEFSMGYQDHIGFRAGTCTPFYWFDLGTNTVTSLQVFPFCIMDVTLKNYMKLSPKQAEKVILELLDSVKKVKGTFISIFHNDSLSEFGEWKGWKTVYEKLIQETQ